ncbi:hypothetical protein BV25DRAFT_235581 [Artomyces pyxidatus]|uniref:Uncharacterized protein n=1 Tax=Artomyces pyxidatus TaxID=48021 RepID=A0ACB8SG80_9AGAM|nr:hypothetical protein BV25DRAFT_235581 [Artomyces pyxidatus]
MHSDGQRRGLLPRIHRRCVLRLSGPRHRPARRRGVQSLRDVGTWSQGSFTTRCASPLFSSCQVYTTIQGIPWSPYARIQVSVPSSRRTDPILYGQEAFVHTQHSSKNMHLGVLRACRLLVWRQACRLVSRRTLHEHLSRASSFMWQPQHVFRSHTVSIPSLRLPSASARALGIPPLLSTRWHARTGVRVFPVYRSPSVWTARRGRRSTRSGGDPECARQPHRCAVVLGGAFPRHVVRRVRCAAAQVSHWFSGRSARNASAGQAHHGDAQEHPKRDDPPGDTSSMFPAGCPPARQCAHPRTLQQFSFSLPTALWDARALSKHPSHPLPAHLKGHTPLAPSHTPSRSACLAFLEPMDSPPPAPPSRSPSPTDTEAQPSPTSPTPIEGEIPSQRSDPARAPVPVDPRAPSAGVDTAPPAQLDPEPRALAPVDRVGMVVVGAASGAEALAQSRRAPLVSLARQVAEDRQAYAREVRRRAEAPDTSAEFCGPLAGGGGAAPSAHTVLSRRALLDTCFDNACS